MTIQEAIKSNKPFKRPDWNFWITADGILDFIDMDGRAIQLLVKDILANDWIIKEEWYEGDFKKKYPNGVLCKVIYLNGNIAYRIIVNYSNEIFTSIEGGVFERDEVIPIGKIEAPAIIGDER